MAGDPLRDAFRNELGSVVATLTGITNPVWPIVDTINVPQQGGRPDALKNFISLRFGMGHESEHDYGSPGSNRWEERGDVFFDLFAVLSSGHDVVESYSRALRNAFRNRRFQMSTGQTVRILTIAPPGELPVDGAWWRETVALTYRVFNLG